ncbi:unnamed protein product [Lymnaea stagnalis]|uniref:receptor protein-tyrosine kinase n=1 Tax=Lymnaea stagnalis TaxID=6523 RepID=A0AAV2H757_LYMST
MNIQHCLCLCLLFATVLAQSNKKGKKKERKKSPEWKPDSMPAIKKQQVSVVEGESTTLDCSASGNPKPDIAWLKNGKKLSKSDKIQGYKLKLPEADNDMGGNYTCKVSNKHGLMEWNFEVTVQVKLWPLLIEGPHNVTQKVGANVAFRCRVINDPQATIRWQKVTGNEEEDSAEELQNLNGDQHVLTINNIQKEHEGMYRCRAGNIWGLKYSNAYLKVIEPVLVPQCRSNFKLAISGDSNIATPISKPIFDMTTRENAAKYDPSYSEPEEKTGMVDSYDFNNEPFYQTTRRPKSRNKDKEQKKKDKKKDKKGKEKMHIEDDLNMYTTPTHSVQSTNRGFPTSTMPVIWTYKDDLDYNGDSDKRLNVQKPDENEDSEPVPTGNAKEADTNNYTGSISSWTIYTIVGAVGGVVLLIGLIAITLTVCCKRDEAGVYKSTPV